jgi:hypothetical protein
MDQLASGTLFGEFVGASLGREGFVLIDVGAAYGVASAWRCFGEKLRGFGFDPDPAEVSRLNSIEPAPGFRYVAGYVGLPLDHPFAEKRRGKPRLPRNPWYGLAVERWLQIQRSRDEGKPIPPRSARVMPQPGAGEERAEEPSPSSIHLPAFLRDQGFGTVDFLKIDVDGTDFDILQSLVGHYQTLGVLGIGVEVNFFGSDADTANSFHNIDRLLKRQGFELFDVTLRRYPTQDLPGPSVAGSPFPASSAFGRVFQGDAFYARDICAPWGWRSETLTGERLAKAAAIFAMFGLPDCAAEILVTFRDRLGSLLDVDHGLNLLAAQAQPGRCDPLQYRDYIAIFEQESYASGGVYTQTALPK